MLLSGNVHKYGDNVNTDVIIPARYCTTVKGDELAKYCMYDIDRDFVKRVCENDVIIAGRNFGCGSSREAAPIAILNSGVKCVIAKSFSRIFYRNAVNIGLWVFESNELHDAINNGEKIRYDIWEQEVYLNNGIKKKLSNTFSDVLNEIIKSGGLVNYFNNTKNG